MVAQMSGVNADIGIYLCVASYICILNTLAILLLVLDHVLDSTWMQYQRSLAC